jgi:hypothetical protein
MSYKITNVNGNYGPNINLTTETISEKGNLYFTEQRAKSSALENRNEFPTYLDKHFYTIGALEQKQGDLFWQVLAPIKIIEITATLGVASEGNSVVIYVQKNGGNSPDKLLYDISIPPLSNKKIVGGERILQQGDYIQVDIASVGTVSPGQNLTVSFKYHNIL